MSDDVMATLPDGARFAANQPLASADRPHDASRTDYRTGRTYSQELTQRTSPRRLGGMVPEANYASSNSVGCQWYWRLICRLAGPFRRPWPVEIRKVIFA